MRNFEMFRPINSSISFTFNKISYFNSVSHFFNRINLGWRWFMGRVVSYSLSSPIALIFFPSVLLLELYHYAAKGNIPHEQLLQNIEPALNNTRNFHVLVQKCIDNHASLKLLECLCNNSNAIKKLESEDIKYFAILINAAALEAKYYNNCEELFENIAKKFISSLKESAVIGTYHLINLLDHGVKAQMKQEFFDDKFFNDLASDNTNRVLLENLYDVYVHTKQIGEDFTEYVIRLAQDADNNIQKATVLQLLGRYHGFSNAQETVLYYLKNSPDIIKHIIDVEQLNGLDISKDEATLVEVHANNQTQEAIINALKRDGLSFKTREKLCNMLICNAPSDLDNSLKVELTIRGLANYNISELLNNGNVDLSNVDSKLFKNHSGYLQKILQYINNDNHTIQYKLTLFNKLAVSSALYCYVNKLILELTQEEHKFPSHNPQHLYTYIKKHSDIAILNSLSNKVISALSPQDLWYYTSANCKKKLEEQYLKEYYEGPAQTNLSKILPLKVQFSWLKKNICDAKELEPKIAALLSQRISADLNKSKIADVIDAFVYLEQHKVIVDRDLKKRFIQHLEYRPNNYCSSKVESLSTKHLRFLLDRYQSFGIHRKNFLHAYSNNKIRGPYQLSYTLYKAEFVWGMLCMLYPSMMAATLPIAIVITAVPAIYSIYQRPEAEVFRSVMLHSTVRIVLTLLAVGIAPSAILSRAVLSMLLCDFLNRSYRIMAAKNNSAYVNEMSIHTLGCILYSIALCMVGVSGSHYAHSAYTWPYYDLQAKLSMGAMLMCMEEIHIFTQRNYRRLQNLSPVTLFVRIFLICLALSSPKYAFMLCSTFAMQKAWNAWQEGNRINSLYLPISFVSFLISLHSISNYHNVFLEFCLESLFIVSIARLILNRITYLLSEVWSTMPGFVKFLVEGPVSRINNFFVNTFNQIIKKDEVTKHYNLIGHGLLNYTYASYFISTLGPVLVEFFKHRFHGTIYSVAAPVVAPMAIWFFLTNLGSALFYGDKYQRLYHKHICSNYCAIYIAKELCADIVNSAIYTSVSLFCYSQVSLYFANINVLLPSPFTGVFQTVMLSVMWSITSMIGKYCFMPDAIEQMQNQWKQDYIEYEHAI